MITILDKLNNIISSIFIKIYLSTTIIHAQEHYSDISFLISVLK